MKKAVGFNRCVLGCEYTFASKGYRGKRKKIKIIAKERNQPLVLRCKDVQSNFFSNHLSHGQRFVPIFK